LSSSAALQLSSSQASPSSSTGGGCQSDSDCPLSQYCSGADGGFLCMPGCHAPAAAWGSSLSPDRCPLGEACVPSCGSSPCTFYCSSSCDIYTCAATLAEPYICVNDDGSGRFPKTCRRSCATDQECPNNEVCISYTGYWQSPSLDFVNACARKCTLDAECDHTVTITGNSCTCAADGRCRIPNDSHVCYQTDPRALAP
jgi:hypothetical protein